MAKKETQFDEGFEEVPLDHSPETSLSVPQSSLQEPSIVDKINSGAQTAGDFAAALGQSTVAGFGDELGGTEQSLFDLLQRGGHYIAPSLVGPSPTEVNQQLKEQGITGDVGPTTLGELYRQGQQETEADLNAREERSPTASLIGEFAGYGVGGAGALKAAKGLPAAIRGGEVTLKAAKAAGGLKGLATELGKRAIPDVALGAAIGAGTSEGGLIGTSDEQKAQLGSDIVHGGATGTLVGAGIGVGTELVPGMLKKAGSVALPQSIKESPLVRQFTTAFKEGTEGRGFLSPQAYKDRLAQETGVAQDVTEKLFGAKDQIGQAIDNNLRKAASEGITINNSNSMINAAEDLSEVIRAKPSLLGRQESQDAQNILQHLKDGKLDPYHANKFRKQIKDMAYSLEDADLRNVAKRFSAQLDNELGNVHGYTKLNQLYHQFLEGPEAILSRVPDELNQTYLSSVNKPKEKVFKGVEKIIEKVEGPGTTGDPQRKAFNEFISKLKEFDTKNPNLLKGLGIDVNKIEQGIVHQSDLTNIRKAIHGVESHGGDLWKDLMGLLRPRGAAYQLANTGGKVVGAIKKKPVELGKAMYKATDDTLQAAAQKLQMNPEHIRLGKALQKAIEAKDLVSKNAVIFAILQNPRTREAVNDDFDEGFEEQK